MDWLHYFLPYIRMEIIDIFMVRVFSEILEYFPTIFWSINVILGYFGFYLKNLIFVQLIHDDKIEFSQTKYFTSDMKMMVFEY